MKVNRGKSNYKEETQQKTKLSKHKMRIVVTGCNSLFQCALQGWGWGGTGRRLTGMYRSQAPGIVSTDSLLGGTLQCVLFSLKTFLSTVRSFKSLLFTKKIYLVNMK